MRPSRFLSYTQGHQYFPSVINIVPSIGLKTPGSLMRKHGSMSIIGFIISLIIRPFLRRATISIVGLLR